MGLTKFLCSVLFTFLIFQGLPANQYESDYLTLNEYNIQQAITMENHLASCLKKCHKNCGGRPFTIGCRPRFAGRDIRNILG